MLVCGHVFTPFNLLFGTLKRDWAVMTDSRASLMVLWVGLQRLIYCADSALVSAIFWPNCCTVGRSREALSIFIYRWPWLRPLIFYTGWMLVFIKILKILFLLHRMALNLTISWKFFFCLFMNYKSSSDPLVFPFKLFHKAEQRRLVMLLSATTLQCLGEPSRASETTGIFKCKLKIYEFSLAKCVL